MTGKRRQNQMAVSSRSDPDARVARLFFGRPRIWQSDAILATLRTCQACPPNARDKLNHNAAEPYHDIPPGAEQRADGDRAKRQGCRAHGLRDSQGDRPMPVRDEPNISSLYSTTAHIPPLSSFDTSLAEAPDSMVGMNLVTSPGARMDLSRTCKDHNRTT